MGCSSASRKSTEFNKSFENEENKEISIAVYEPTPIENPDEPAFPRKHEEEKSSSDKSKEKTFSKTNITTKRNSATSLEKITVKHDFGVKIKENKKIIITFLKKIIKNLSREKKINLLLASQKVVKITKTDFTEVAVSNGLKFSFINKVNWNKSPYQEIRNQINSFFAENPQYSQYYLFDFSNRKHLKEYQKMPSEENTFVKFIPTKGEITTEGVSFAQSNSVKVLLFFDSKSVPCLKLIQMLINYKKVRFDLYLIYGKKIQNEKEPNYILEVLTKNGVSLSNKCIYFITEYNQNNVEKYFSFSSNDEKQTINPLVVLIDRNGIIRHINNVEEFSLGLIGLTELGKEKFNEDIEKIITHITTQTYTKMPYRCNLSMSKATIYSFVKEEEDGDLEFKKQEKYYEGVNGYVTNSSIISCISKIEYFNIACHNEIDEYTDSKRIKLLNSIIESEISNFTSVVGVELKNYQSRYKYSKTILSLSEDKDKKFDISQEKSFSIEFKLTHEMFSQQIHMAVTGAFSALTEYGYFGSVNCISCGLKDLDVMNNITLINSESKSIEEIRLVNLTKPTMFVVFSYPNNFIDEMVNEYKFKKLLPFVKKRQMLNTYFIFKGEIEEFEKYKTEKENSLIFNDTRFNVYIADSTTSTPFHFELFSSNESYFNVMLIDANSTIVYNGNLSGVNITQLVSDVMDNYETTNYEVPTVTKDEIDKMISEFEKELEIKFSSETSSLRYRPYVNVTYDVISNCSDVESLVTNICLFVLVKENHSHILRTPEVKKIIRKLKSFEAIVLVFPIQCVNPEISVNCFKCNTELSEEEPFYFEQNDGVGLCEKCENKLEFHNEDLIYIKASDFDNEIIDDFYSSSNNDYGEVCDLCKCKFGEIVYMSMIQWKMSKKFSPLCICSGCFREILEDKIEEEKKNLYYLDKNNMIYKKVLL